MENNFFPSLSADASGDVLGLKRSINNGPPRLTSSPNVSSLNSSANASLNQNLNRLFPYPTTSSLANIPSLYQNAHMFTNSNLSNLSHPLNALGGAGGKTLSLPMHRPDYLTGAINAAASRDSIQTSLGSNAHLSLNHRRRPSLLQSAVYSNEYGALNTQYLPYLNREDREQIINNHMGRKVTLLPQHYSPANLTASSTGSLTANAASITTSQPFNPHLALAQSTPPLSFLPAGTTQSTGYLDSDALTAFNKRPRLSSVQPLLIDTNTVEIKKEPAYTVQVEAISPTPAEDTRADGSPVRTTKDDILQQIGQIDREITQTENQMSKLKKKQQELEALTNKTGKSSDLNEYLESKQQSITQVIYFENKKKAQDSQQLLEPLGPRIVLPIYNQPSDNRVYHENREKFVRFKGVLQEHFKRKLRRKQQREQFLTENYDKLMQEWLSKLESKDTNPVKKNKDNKLREFFEKQFPELKKLREDKERLSRAGQRVRSDADLEDIMDGIQEQELEDKKIRAYAVIPPIMHDVNERTYRFRTNNCKIDDPVREHKELMYLNVWTPVEKEIFREKFLQAPKNFGLIASYLERKSVADCVQYYYSSKKRENYKSLLRKNAKKRTRALAKQQQLAAQQAAQQEQAQQLQKTLALQQAKKQSEMENLAKNDNKSADAKEDGQAKKPADAIKEEPTEDDENCFKCINCQTKIEPNEKVFVVNRTNCFLYGLSVEDVKRDSRLCKKCKVQFGTGECPVPSCKALKKSNRRLKTLPREWFELTPEKRYIISAELNFPLDCRRCCTRCWIRLIRKSGSSFTANKERTMRKFLHCVWDDAEIEKLKAAISKNGRNWETISASQVVTKSAAQCRQFYFYFKYNQNLEELMKMTTFQTDDFDSDTCWNEIQSDSESSEDEYLVERKILDPNLERLQDCKRLSSSQLSLKSDSSTTISADEAQSALGEFDSRVTPPSRSSSVVPAHLAGSGNSYLLLNDKMRPASSDNLDIDSKLKTNQKYLNSSLQKQRNTPTFSSMNKPTPMPAFVKYLINPNAPTVQPSNQSKQSRQDSPIQSGMNTPTLSQPQTPQSAGLAPSTGLASSTGLTPSTGLASGPMFSGSSASQPPPLSAQPTISAQQTLAAQPSKDKATCVRDLIYQTIDFTFNSSDKNTTPKPLEIKGDAKPTPSITPSSLSSIYFPAELKRDTVLGDLSGKSLAANPALQHILPYNLSNLSAGLSMAGHLNEMQDEVQDLSKKGGKKELDDYMQPKNYSLSKSKNSDFGVNLSSSVFGASAMPPPAHSNQLSSRTATPVLDMSASAQQEQLQNFYLNTANRHTDSPRSLKNQQQQQQLYSPLTGEQRLGTPNHHLSSASPTPTGSSRSGGNKPSNAQSKVNIAPPPLIANSLINAANQQFSAQQGSKNAKNNLPPASLQGSITHGTPVHLTGQTAAEILQQQQQYLLNKESESAVGRITLGTPLYPRGNGGANNRTNMPKMNYLPGQNTGFNLPAGLAANLISPNLAKSNFGNETQLSSTQSQIMIDFNTSKQMQKQRNTGLSDSNSKERSSPLSLSRSIQLGTGFPPGSLPAGYPPLPLGFNPSAMNKTQSPLLIETSKSNSPKTSVANFQPNNNKNQPASTVIQTPQLPKTSMASMMPSIYQAHDAFQTLVNAAASQQSLAVPQDSGKSKDTIDQLKDKSGFFNHSALKFSRNPFTKEQFEKEIKSQDLIKKQQQKMAEESAAKAAGRKTPLDLDNQASKIFSDSFQKDSSRPSGVMTASGLIDAIIAHQINQPEKNDKSSPFNPGGLSSGGNFGNDPLKSFMDSCGPLISNQSMFLPAAVSTNPSIISSTSSSPSLAGLATSKASSDDLMNENWKLRKALEQKEAAQRKESGKVESSQIELEPISPPSTPTKEQQQQQQQSLASSLNLSAASLKQMPWSNEMASQLSSSLSALAQSQAISNQQSALLSQQSSLSNLQLAADASNKAPADPAGFQKFFQSRFAQAMSTDQQQPDKEPDTKKLKLEGEMKEEAKKDTSKGENNKTAYSTPPPLDKLPSRPSVESISSLSELKAQREAATKSSSSKNLN